LTSRERFTFWNLKTQPKGLPMGSDSLKFTDSRKSFWNHVVPQISTDSPPKLPALPLFTNVTLRFFFPDVLFSFQRVPTPPLRPHRSTSKRPGSASSPSSSVSFSFPGSPPAAAAPGSAPTAAPGSPPPAAPGSPPWRARVAVKLRLQSSAQGCNQASAPIKRRLQGMSSYPAP
jgi:hypothetical protein